MAVVIRLILELKRPGMAYPRKKRPLEKQPSPGTEKTLSDETITTDGRTRSQERAQVMCSPPGADTAESR